MSTNRVVFPWMQALRNNCIQEKTNDRRIRIMGTAADQLVRKSLLLIK